MTELETAPVKPVGVRFSPLLVWTLVNRLTHSYIVRSIVQALFTIWLVTTFTFLLIRLLPGGPIQTYIDKLTRNGDMTYEQAAARASAMFGSDVQKPVIEQYLSYLNNILHGNMGVSITSTDTPVLQIIATFLPWTLFSVGLSLLLSFVIGLGLGMLMAYWRNGIFDVVVTTVSSFLSSIPNYVIAVLILYFFGVRLGVFSVAAARGAYTPGIQVGFTLAFFVDILTHAMLPLMTYWLSSFGGWALTMKNSTLGTLGEEYVTVAQARGLGRGRIMMAYVGRNAVLPLFTQLALSIAFVIGGSVIIERYFSYPGLGLKLSTAILDRDYPVMQGIFLVITIAVVVANLLTDFLYSRLDPRVRLAKG
ncbi:MAG: ABC transporter permease [Aggregatilineales bacterium]